jgi:phosphopantothenoylcysteine decarboxylase/phosphopantothenate--cysteine ligase
MGFALAECLAAMGARVIMVCGPVQLKTNHPSIQRIDVTSADEMYAACLKYFDSCDGAIMTAAVADYAPVKIEKEKIKRSHGNMVLELRPNKDIAAELGKLKKPNQILVGFALESQNEMENAFSKLKSKNLDMIVLNSLKEEGAGFGFDTNKITILTRDGKVFNYPLKSKQEVAADIVKKMISINYPSQFD